MAPHILVTNDFPPKVGGIQTYLWELWRRLPPGDVTVVTTAHPDSVAFDAAQAFRIVRMGEKILVPTPGLARRIEALVQETGATLVVLDPALPLGLIGRRLSVPYAVVLHGSELIGRLPVGGGVMGWVLAGAELVIAAGSYPAAEARRVAGGRTPPITVVPPGVDAQLFRPLGPDERAAARRRIAGVDDDDCQLVVGVSRLVPRKGFDVLIDAVAELRSSHPKVELVIAGTGRDHDRLARRIAAIDAPARLLGRVDACDLPALYASADLFVMCCRTRWLGLEPEGFGIVFLEAAACGVAQLAGDSGGAADAVADGDTGLIVQNPRDHRFVADAIACLLDAPGRLAAMGRRSRERVLRESTYEHLAETLADALAGVFRK